MCHTDFSITTTATDFLSLYYPNEFFKVVFMSSLYGVYIRIPVNDFSSKTTRLRDRLFFLKNPYLSRMKNCCRHADLFVRLFARVITSEVPPTLNMKISTLYYNFLIAYCRDFSHILHICTDSVYEYQAWIFLNVFRRVECNQPAY